MSFEDDPFRAPEANDKPAAVVDEKPTSVMVFGVFQIIFGGLSLCITPFTLVTVFMPELVDFGGQNPVIELYKDPVFFAFTLFSSVVLLIASIAQLTSGLQLVNGKSMGRKLAIWVACYSIVAAFVNSIFNAIYLAPVQIQQAPPGQQETMKIVFYVSYAVGALMAIIYPVLVLIFMNRKTVLEYFQRKDERKESGFLAS